MKRSSWSTARIAMALVACAQADRGAAAPVHAASAAPPRATTEAPGRSSCFLLREVGGPLRVQRGEACARRVAPASTFKVPHALIALDVGARTGPDDPEAWDGVDHEWPYWNRDQTLATAMRYSVVWYFQRTAARIGRERMAAGLAAIHYGNQEIGGDLTHFWLGGPLTISPVEQADFMDALARRALPFRREHMDAVDALILQSPGTIARAAPVTVDVTWDAPSTQIYAKTGSTHVGREDIRWLVGHVAAGGRAYAFASLVVDEAELSTEAVVSAMHELRDAGLVRPKA